MLVISKLGAEWKTKTGGKKGNWLFFDLEKAVGDEKQFATPNGSKVNGNFVSFFKDEDTERFKVGDDLTENWVVVAKPKEGGNGFWLNLHRKGKGKSVSNEETKLAFMHLNQKLDTVVSQLKKVIEHLSGENRLDLTSAGTKIPDFSEVDEQFDEAMDNPNS